MVDRILSAVACAGKAFHHTEAWSDPVWDYDADGAKAAAPYEPFLRGMTPIDWIQNAALDLAEDRRRLVSRLAEQGIAL